VSKESTLIVTRKAPAVEGGFNLRELFHDYWEKAKMHDTANFQMKIQAIEPLQPVGVAFQ